MAKNRVTHLWKRSCSAFRSILLANSLSTFSFNFSSSCWDVSIQYSAVHKILQILHCSSSVSFEISPSFKMFWINPDADEMLEF